jgi:CMP-N-acetylneuraminic acid synthetase/spore coat polysaccharide biosynthesis predicted glycosyltransferase SpsG
MIEGNRIIVVIPARGGSKGIPRKNIRFLAGKPLIAYSIENSLKSRYVDTVLVSTDDDEIAYFANLSGAKTLKRPENLAKDDVPLDPVIHHAVLQLEETERIKYSTVITIQPTSPLLSTNTIDKAIERFLDCGCDTLLSVVDDRHLSWAQKDGQYIPNYQERKNRQYLPPNYKETGGILITKRSFVTAKSRFGAKIDLIEVPQGESIDIDSIMDWWITEKILNRRKILIRVDGYKEIGLGHIYRTLLLANRLIDHELLFVIKKEHQLGENIICSNNYPLRTFSVETEFEKILDDFHPDIVINDILDTSLKYVRNLKKRNLFVVNFEDMGEGSKKADLVINALYNETFPMPNYYCGKDYYCLREEFYLLKPKEITPQVHNILITFGGTDSHDYTKKVLQAITKLVSNKIKITIILGLGYEGIDDLNSEIANLDIIAEVEIKQNIKNISKYMNEADITFTSAGRTVYELASLGTPTIVLAQNNRELRHTFACADNGIINLGLGYEVSEEEIRNTFIRLTEDYDLRKKCHQLMLQNNLRSGVGNVLELIFNQYKQFRGGC